jgi:NADH-quinone oxidoreductase subunit C
MTVAGIALAPEVETALRERFCAVDVADGPMRIEPAQHLALARALRDEFGYRIFGFVIASHHPNNKQGDDPADQLRAIFGLRSIGSNSRLAVWQLQVEVGQSVPSLVELFAGADWQEREQYDLVGIRFANHPDLRRLMLPGDWKGHPLRKDYAIETEVPPWR